MRYRCRSRLKPGRRVEVVRRWVARPAAVWRETVGDGFLGCFRSLRGSSSLREVDRFPEFVFQLRLRIGFKTLDLPLDEFSLTLLLLLLADLEDFAGPNSKIGDSARDDRRHVHDAVVCKGVHYPIAVAALDGFTGAGVLQGHLGWDIHFET